MKRFFTALAISAAVLAGAVAARADDLKVALIHGRTGPLEAYAKQTETGLRLGFEYATKGTMEIDGRKIVILTKDDQGKPDLAKSALTEAYEDDGVDIAIGTTSSPATIAMLPIAEEHKKILIVEPAVADQITGDKWNRYIFRTGRNSSQDAISNAVAIGAPGVSIAVLGVDNAFGRDGVAAFKSALAKTGATLTDRTIVLIRTGRDTLMGTKAFWTTGTGMSASATEWLIDQGPTVMGIDQWGWDLPFQAQIAKAKATGDDNLFWEAHRVGLRRPYWHMEQLTNLGALPPSGFEVMVFPLKIVGASAAPARVVAVIR